LSADGTFRQAAETSFIENDFLNSRPEGLIHGPSYNGRFSFERTEILF
jgi:hypothetical protein